MSKMAIFYLTCPNEEEADKISKVLLDKRLVACAKRFPVKSKSWWKGKMGSADEVLVSYETVEENFEKVNSEVKKLHSDETYVLYSVAVSKTTKKVEDWTKKELGK